MMLCPEESEQKRIIAVRSDGHKFSAHIKEERSELYILSMALRAVAETMYPENFKICSVYI